MSQSQTKKGLVKRIWRGDIQLAWAFWGGWVLTGFLYAALIIAAISSRLFISEFYSSLLTRGLFQILFPFLVYQTVSVWRSANNNPSPFWARAAKSAVVIGWLTGLTPPTLPFILFFIVSMHQP
jgi:hypothetical protein